LINGTHKPQRQLCCHTKLQHCNYNNHDAVCTEAGNIVGICEDCNSLSDEDQLKDCCLSSRDHCVYDTIKKHCYDKDRSGSCVVCENDNGCCIDKLCPGVEQSKYPCSSGYHYLSCQEIDYELTYKKDLCEAYKGCYWQEDSFGGFCSEERVSLSCSEYVTPRECVATEGKICVLANGWCVENYDDLGLTRQFCPERVTILFEDVRVGLLLGGSFLALGILFFISTQRLCDKRIKKSENPSNNYNNDNTSPSYNERFKLRFKSESVGGSRDDVFEAMFTVVGTQ